MKKQADGTLILPKGLAAQPEGEDAVEHVAWAIARLDPEMKLVRAHAQLHPEATLADCLKFVGGSYINASREVLTKGYARGHGVFTATAYLQLLGTSLLTLIDYGDLVKHYLRLLEFKGTEAQALGR